MQFLTFQSCKADADVWVRCAIKFDGSEYWEYALLYCDDVRVIIENDEPMLRNVIEKYSELKEESIEPFSIFLGGKMRKVILNIGVEVWNFSSSQYVQAAFKNVEEYLAKED